MTANHPTEQCNTVGIILGIVMGLLVIAYTMIMTINLESDKNKQ